MCPVHIGVVSKWLDLSTARNLLQSSSVIQN